MPRIIADTVAAPIEQQVVGVEKMLYMSSQSNNDGSYVLDVTFAVGTDVNIAQVLLQNRVAIAQPALPDIVKAIGVTVRKQSPDILLIVNLYSDVNPDDNQPYYDPLYLGNYATINLLDVLARVDGVGDVFPFGGQDYSMRVLAEPDQSAGPEPVGQRRAPGPARAERAGGGRADRPAAVPQGQDFQYTLNTLGRLMEPEEFARTSSSRPAEGQVIYLKDVSRTELGGPGTRITP